MNQGWIASFPGCYCKKSFFRRKATISFHLHIPPLLQCRELPHKMRRALIPPRIPIQIQLMILLRIPPLPRLQDLRAHGPLFPPLLLHLLRDFLRLLLLLRGVVEDGAAVLRTRVHALAVLGRGVVHLVEELEEGGVGELGGVECHLEGFGVCGFVCQLAAFFNSARNREDEREGRTACASGADGSIAWILRVATNVPDSSV